MIGINGVMRDVHKCRNYIEYTKPPAIQVNAPNASRELLERLGKEILVCKAMSLHAESPEAKETVVMTAVRQVAI